MVRIGKRTKADASAHEFKVCVRYVKKALLYGVADHLDSIDVTNSNGKASK